jgi:sulfatase modifying factor 1
MSRAVRQHVPVCLALLAGCTRFPEPTPIPDGPLMVTVPAGWFLMGSESGPASSQPAHWVHLDAYKIDATEVTISAVRTYLRQSGASLTIGSGFGPPDHPAWPVVGLLWTEAREDCRWRGARLPTEAEWEKAARGTDGRTYPWGDISHATRSDTSEASFGHPVPVGSFHGGTSPHGLFDMAGNVAEWVGDYFDAMCYASAPAANPTPARQTSSTTACAEARGRPISA